MADLATLAFPASDLASASASPAQTYLARLTTAQSQASMRKALVTIVRLVDPQGALEAFPWHQLRYQHTQAIRALLVARYAPATVNKVLSALRGVLLEAFKLGLMTAEEHSKASAVEGSKNRQLPAGRAVETSELARLFSSVTASDPLSVRDRAILGLLFTTGLRRSELVGADLADFAQASGSLMIRGKGGKERLVYVTNECKSLLSDWLAIRGNEAGPLFYPARKGGHLEARRMSDQAVYNVVKDRATKAKIDSFSPHDARRTFISNAIDASKDLIAVSSLAGHSSVQTTARYDRRGEVSKKAVSRMIHLPLSKEDLYTWS
jgi:site-specific recombinase XerC